MNKRSSSTSGSEPPSMKGAKRGKTSDSKVKKLADLDCYHYYLPREEADTMLKEEGDFLIRESVMADKRAAIVLSVRVSPKEVKHFPAEFNTDDNLFYFTEGIGRGAITELIEHHVQHKLLVRGSRLKRAIPRNKWEILEDKIQFDEKILGEGNFAVVRMGKLLLNGSWVNVACKKLKMDRCKNKFDKDKAKLQILREFQIGRVLSGHLRILNVYGIFVGTEELAVVMELCDGGALDRYIEKNPNRPVYEKVSYLLHAAGGLSHMHRLNLIHRDVATRNFLVVKREQKNLLPLIKVADFGLTRPGPVYKMKSEHEVPYLISALECLNDEPIWMLKSDCWSFGVFIWHVFEECKAEPYADQLLVNSAAVREQLKQGIRLKPHADMPIELQRLMAECFNADPEKRPSMSEIEKRITPVLRTIWEQSTGTRIN